MSNGYDRSDRHLFGVWWLWVLMLVVITVVVLGATGFAGRWLGVTGDRLVFETSYQKHSADAAREKALQAELIAIRSRLSAGGLSESERADLNAQAAGLQFQLNSGE